MSLRLPNILHPGLVERRMGCGWERAEKNRNEINLKDSGGAGHTQVLMVSKRDKQLHFGHPC